MLSINLTKNNKTNQYKYNSNINFNGKAVQDELITIMPLNASKLVKKMNKFLENEWKNIRKTKQEPYENPHYTIAGKNDKIALITPLYQGYKKFILFEILKGKNTERIIIDRQNPNSFKYEKVIDTQYGQATTQSFNSDLQRSNAIELKVAEYIEEYFPKILSNQDNIL